MLTRLPGRSSACPDSTLPGGGGEPLRPSCTRRVPFISPTGVPDTVRAQVCSWVAVDAYIRVTACDGGLISLAMHHV